ncbi:MAG: oxygen-dependent tRNA uridine(34) hydroxylase TrhO [Gammaproteobacteria bacterium]|jgi:UPF0176 protein
MIEKEEIIVATFYKFVPIEGYETLRVALLDVCNTNHLRGTILLAAEGINATVAGTRNGIDALLVYLNQDQRFISMEYKESVSPELPFYRMKIKIKNEIVALGVPGTDPNSQTGIRVAAEDWDSLINDPEVLVIDVRNKYECDIGSFENATMPDTENFREFPDYVNQNLDPLRNKKIAMYCTGGIRCEKASAYLLNNGYEKVYQLDGGILRYLEQVNHNDSLWQGECFVFDGRVAVDQALQKGEHDQCYACRHPVSQDDMQSINYLEGISCPHCFDSLTSDRRARMEERQRQVKLAEGRNQQHIGMAQTRIKNNID